MYTFIFYGTGSVRSSETACSGAQWRKLSDDGNHSSYFGSCVPSLCAPPRPQPPPLVVTFLKGFFVEVLLSGIRDFSLSPANWACLGWAKRDFLSLAKVMGGALRLCDVCGAKPPCLFLWGEALKLSRLALASLVGGPTRAPLPFCPPARATSPWLPGRWTLLQ